MICRRSKLRCCGRCSRRLRIRKGHHWAERFAVSPPPCSSACRSGHSGNSGDRGSSDGTVGSGGVFASAQLPASASSSELERTPHRAPQSRYVRSPLRLRPKRLSRFLVKVGFQQSFSSGISARPKTITSGWVQRLPTTPTGLHRRGKAPPAMAVIGVGPKQRPTSRAEFGTRPVRIQALHHPHNDRSNTGAASRVCHR